MSKTLNTLILEDSQSDAFLLVRELRRGGFEVNHLRIDNADDLKKALVEQEWDIILSDYNMPGFDALAAIKIVKERGLDLPIILVSGLVDEDIAVTAMKAGASDFFSKDKLARLVPAVERELREAAGRRKQHEAEMLFTTAFHAGPVGSVISRVSDGAAIDVNARFLDIFGYTRDDIIGKRSSELGIWRNQPQRQALLKQLLETGSLRSAEVEVRKRWGIEGYALVSAEVIHFGGERCILTMVHDISERKATENALQRYTERLELLHEIDHAILRADDPETISQSVLARLQTLMGYHSASVTTFDEESYHFTVLATASPLADVLPAGTRRPIENREMTEALKRNEIYLINDLANTTPISTTEKSLLAIGIRSIARIPLLAKGKLLGAFIFHSTEANAFSAQQLDIAREAAAQLAIALHSAQLYQQIQNHALELEQRVRERTLELQASEASLRVALAQEKELNELKTRFVSMVSHDFRTPLTIIQSNTNLLESSLNQLDEEKKARYFSRIHTQIQRMVNLLDDVLNFGRAGAGTSALNLVALDLDQFCRGIADEFQSTHEMKHTLVYSGVYSGATETTRVPVDEKLLQQAVSNLLTNAFKYSPEGSTVFLELAQETDQAVIKVKDSGIGIPQADQPHLFDMFHRAGNVGTITGTGLGLAIVKRAVEAHGGLVEVESSEGIGSTFTVKLPLFHK
jgi:PAS domain S-box-containing protein